MGRTLTELKGLASNPGNVHERIFAVSFDATYVATGEPISARQVGMRQLSKVQGPGTLPSNHSVYYDFVLGRLKVLLDGAEVAGGTNLSTLTNVRVAFTGW